MTTLLQMPLSIKSHCKSQKGNKVTIPIFICQWCYHSFILFPPGSHHCIYFFGFWFESQAYNFYIINSNSTFLRDTGNHYKTKHHNPEDHNWQLWISVETMHFLQNKNYLNYKCQEIIHFNKTYILFWHEYETSY